MALVIQQQIVQLQVSETFRKYNSLQSGTFCRLRLKTSVSSLYFDFFKRNGVADIYQYLLCNVFSVLSVTE